MSELVTLVGKLRQIAWVWTKANLEQVASELGLIDPTTGSHRWIGYRSPDPEFPSPDPDYPVEFMEHPYAFSFRGQEVSHFHLTLGAVDMGEVYLHESDRYNEVCKKKDSEFKSNFKRSVKQITTVLGKPTFQGQPNDDVNRAAYPLGWGSEMVAAWPLPNARAMLVYGREDKELPILLELFVCPPLEE